MTAGRLTGGLLWLILSGCGHGGPGMGGADGGMDAAQVVDAGSSDTRRVRRRLATSNQHTCALRSAGLFCWGSNFLGQLGMGDMLDREQPTRVPIDAADIEEVVVRTGRTCIRRSSGQVACWGSNEKGELGDGTHELALSPRVITAVDDAVSLSLDIFSSCALRRGGSVVCWGGASEPDASALQPVTIENLDGVVQLEGGISGTYCARGAAGWVRCWNGVDGTWSAASDAETLQGARDLTLSGADIACGLVESSEVVCEVLETGLPYVLGDSGGSQDLAGDQLIACAADDEKRWRCWNILRPMLESVGSFPLDIDFMGLPAVELAMGGFKACALLRDERVLCTDGNIPPTAMEVSGLPD